jgi:hypothetical protein
MFRRIRHHRVKTLGLRHIAASFPDGAIVIYDQHIQ